MTAKKKPLPDLAPGWFCEGQSQFPIFADADTKDAGDEDADASDEGASPHP